MNYGIPRLAANQKVLHWIALFSALAYLFVRVNVPIALQPAAGHDDGLFIAHAQDIVSGRWLGPYSQFTLMKGPGYALFLAALALFRVPATLAQAVLYCSSVYVFSYASEKIFHSAGFSLIVFETLLWNYGSDTLRTSRETIYTPEILLTFGFLLLALFAENLSRRLLCASLAGFALGWFWITREEGILVIPSILLLFLSGMHQAYRGRLSFRVYVKSLIGFLSAFASVLIVVSLINLSVYKTFCVVDIKGTFETALEALSSVRPDVYIPYVSVPKSAREKIYLISPTFARLQSLLDSPGSPMEGWRRIGCGLYPDSCGDYAAGWFIWALRDAVALQGYYSSAPKTDKFYRDVANEVKEGCDSGMIHCYHRLLPFMPRVDKSQLSRIPGSLKSAAADLSFVIPPLLQAPSSLGFDEMVRSASSFLNVVNHTAPPEPISHSRLEGFATEVRHSIIRVSSRLFPVLILLGSICTFILAAGSISSKSYSIGFAILISAWMAVVLRVVALVMIDISSFGAIDHGYLSYAFPFVCYASLLAILLVIRHAAFRLKKDFRSNSPDQSAIAIPI